MNEEKIIIAGDAEFIARETQRLREDGIDREIEAVEVETQEEAQAAIDRSKPTDADYRRALKDDTVPDAVKKAIRKYFADQVKSTMTKLHPIGRNQFGKPLPHRSPDAYQKPKDMTARQWKKMKKAKFREFRQTAQLIKKVIS